MRESEWLVGDFSTASPMCDASRTTNNIRREVVTATRPGLCDTLINQLIGSACAQRKFKVVAATRSQMASCMADYGPNGCDLAFFAEPDLLLVARRPFGSASPCRNTQCSGSNIIVGGRRVYANLLGNCCRLSLYVNVANIILHVPRC